MKIETIIVFLAFLIWAHHTDPTAFKWSDLLNPSNAQADIALAELVGMSIFALIPATIYYYIRKPKAKRDPPNLS